MPHTIRQLLLNLLLLPPPESEASVKVRPEEQPNVHTLASMLPLYPQISVTCV